MDRSHLALVLLLASVPLAAAGCSSNDPSGTSDGSEKTDNRPATSSPVAESQSAGTADLAALSAITIYPHKAVCAASGNPREARCLAQVQTDDAGNVRPSAAPRGLSPADIQSAYNLHPGSNAPIVAIVDAYDDPNAEADLAIYRAQFGLPPCTTANGCFSKVNQNGTRGSYPVFNQAWMLEISLDVDAVSAACPNCKILLVEANSSNMSDLGASVNTAVRLGAVSVSNSWASPEDASVTSDEEAYFNHPGVLITASSGDAGYGALFPATSKYVLAIGGTSLVRSTTNARGWAEGAWNLGGSGCSAFIQKPSWQHDTGCTRRSEADISAVGDPNTGLGLYSSFDGGWVVTAGTSLSSPLVAAMYALAGRAGEGPQFAYAHPSWFNDITTGTNGSCGGSYLCATRVGFDGPTGLGTPNLALWTTNGDAGTPEPPVDSGPVSAPEITLRTPVDGASVPANTALSLSATVKGASRVVLDWTNAGSVVQVDCDALPANTTCTRSGDTVTFVFTPGAGTRSWAIEATNTNGVTTSSATRTLTLASATAPSDPSVTITSPLPQTSFAKGGTVPLRIQATGTRGVSQVWLTWSGAAGTTQLQLSYLGGTTWGVDIPVQATALRGPRTLTVTAYDPGNVTGSQTTTIQVQ